MLTLSHAFQTFLAQPTFAARTRESYVEDLAPLMRTLGQAPIAALTAQVTTAFLAAQEHLAPSTYNRRLAALRSFVRWLQDQSFMESDPLEGLRRRPLRPLPPRALNAEHVEAMLRAIQDPCGRALFWLIYESGLRVNEALSLKTFQRLGYAVSLTAVPVRVVDHIANQVGLTVTTADLIGYDASGTRRRHLRIIRTHLGISAYGPEAQAAMEQAMAEAALGKDDLTDLINIALEEMVRQHWELPAFSAFSRAATKIRSRVNNGFHAHISMQLSVDILPSR